MDRLNPYVFVGAGLGGMIRRALNPAVPKRLGTDFSWATPILNLTGSAAMGFLAFWLALRAQAALSLRLLAASGVRGGCATFSTFSRETERAAYAPYGRGSASRGIAGPFSALAPMRSLA
jgi:CrcB protein